jgi:hypothetical protein
LAKFVRENVSKIASPLLAMATLGDVTQIEMILSVLCRPRRPREVRKALRYRWHYCAKPHQWKLDLSGTSISTRRYLIAPFQSRRKSKPSVKISIMTRNNKNKLSVLDFKFNLTTFQWKKRTILVEMNKNAVFFLTIQKFQTSRKDRMIS